VKPTYPELPLGIIHVCGAELLALLPIQVVTVELKVKSTVELMRWYMASASETVMFRVRVSVT
jgi:hypothetical protein